MPLRTTRRRPVVVMPVVVKMVVVMAVAVLALLGATVMGASAAAADDRTGEPVATPAAAVTRPSVLPVSTGLTDVGPVVPALLGLTALMLVGGAGVLWQRCREQSRA